MLYPCVIRVTRTTDPVSIRDITAKRTNNTFIFILVSSLDPSNAHHVNDSIQFDVENLSRCIYFTRTTRPSLLRVHIESLISLHRQCY